MSFGAGGFGGCHSCLAIWHLLVFFINNSNFRVSLRVARQIYIFKVRSCLVVAKQFSLFKPGIKATICKINNFSIVTSIFPKYCCTQLSCTKNSCGEI